MLWRRRCRKTTRRLAPRPSGSTSKGRPFLSSGKTGVEGLSVDEGEEEPRERVRRIEGSARVQGFRIVRGPIPARVQEAQRGTEILLGEGRRLLRLVLDNSRVTKYSCSRSRLEARPIIDYAGVGFNLDTALRIVLGVRTRVLTAGRVPARQRRAGVPSSLRLATHSESSFMGAYA